MMHSIVNTEQAEAWNGYEGHQWADNQDRWDAVNGGFNGPLFEAATIGERDQVLDIGCGNGQTTRLAARQASGGQALGIDLSTPMLHRARGTAADEGLMNVRFEQGDAQVYPRGTLAFDAWMERNKGLMTTAPMDRLADASSLPSN